MSYFWQHIFVYSCGHFHHRPLQAIEFRCGWLLLGCTRLLMHPCACAVSYVPESSPDSLGLFWSYLLRRNAELCFRSSVISSGGNDNSTLITFRRATIVGTSTAAFTERLTTQWPDVHFMLNQLGLFDFNILFAVLVMVRYHKCVPITAVGWQQSWTRVDVPLPFPAITHKYLSSRWAGARGAQRIGIKNKGMLIVIKTNRCYCALSLHGNSRR